MKRQIFNRKSRRQIGTVSGSIASQILRLMFTLCLSAGLFLTTTASNPADITLTVKVTDCQTGQPIAGASVKVPTAATSFGTKNRGTTNNDGMTIIDPVRTGDKSHTVEVTKEGYEKGVVNQYMRAWSAVLLEICLNPLNTPTPTTTLTTEPGITPSPEPGNTNACSGFILEKLKPLIPEDYVPYLQCEAQSAASCTINCTRSGAPPLRDDFLACGGNGNDDLYGGCGNDVIAKAVAEGIATGKADSAAVIQAFVQLLTDNNVQEKCGHTGILVQELVYEINHLGAFQFDLTGLHSPANIMVADNLDRRTGFLPDGTTLEEIPGSRAVFSGESKYILFPADEEAKISIEGTGEGFMHLDMVDVRRDQVQDMSFFDVEITDQSKGNLILTEPQPELEIDTSGDGTLAAHPPDRYRTAPVLKGEILSPTATLTSSPSPTASQTLTPTSTAETTTEANTTSLLITGGLIGAGLLLLIETGIAIIAGLFMYLSRPRAQSKGK